MLGGTAVKSLSTSNTPNGQVDVASGTTKAISQKRPRQGALCVSCLAGAKAQNEQDRGESGEDCQGLGPRAENTCVPLLPAYLQTCENQASRACFTQVLKSEKERGELRVSWILSCYRANPQGSIVMDTGRPMKSLPQTEELIVQ